MANPGVDIPADATAIHRITTEQARRDGRPAAEVSAEVSARNLAAVCAHYQVRLDNAHDSADDAVAAARLAWRLAKTQPARIGLVDPHVLHSHQARWHHDREFAYADKLDLSIRRLTAQGGDTDEVARLRARAAAARASARSWPLLPVTTADSQPVTAHLKQIHDEVRRTS